MPRTWLHRIAALDPATDDQEIYRISIGHEFPFDYQRALEFALFRTYCVPSISALLAATGEFEKRPQQRYDDTALLMAELAEHGYDSERGKQALRVINRAHGRYVISNDDMLYVLSTFVYDPIDWIEQFGWQALIGVALPVATSWLLFLASWAWLPRHLFVYLFVAAFLGGALSISVKIIASALLMGMSGAYPWHTISADYLSIWPLLLFPEALLNGMAMTLLAVYRPHWVNTFFDREYLGR